jgi:exodeoxyribonuclease V gamma subunit
VFEEDKTASPESFDISEISLDQMGTFFKHPVKYFFNRILNVYYRSDEERLPETELFALNNLMEWKIKDDLLQPGTDAAEYTQRNKMKGQLPLATMGEVMVQQLKKEIHPLQQKFYDIIAQDVPQRIAIHYADKDTIVKGSLEVYGDKYVFICHSKSILKYVIVSWVNYLFARASGHDRLAFHFVFNNEKGDPETLFVGQDEISAAEVRVQVQRLISFFKMGHEQPFSFYAPFAYYYYHQPNGASEPVCQINREELYANYETFVEDDRKDKYNRVFTDGGYLEKVIEEQDTDSGYFSTASVDDMNENIPKLMQFLYEKAPKIFK